MFLLDIKKILSCVWYFATASTFSLSNFRKATSLFFSIYKYTGVNDRYSFNQYRHLDIFLAELYSKKKVGGENAIREPIQKFLNSTRDSATLTTLASALMWMNAYQSEQLVLQYMLTTGIEMAAKLQERLHSLSNGGGNAPTSFSVKTSANSLYFDVSALAWKDKDYTNLFESLAFQDKKLTYSLAIRDESKELFIPQGIDIPDKAIIIKKLQTIFAEEYGSSAKVQSINGVALSGSGEEIIPCILASSNECRQLGILIHITKIGKKLIIKFYTLFMPIDGNLAVQKQQALSLCQKLSPTITMWESSMKDTMLMSVEQLLNMTAEKANISTTFSVPESVSEKPIF